MSQGLDLTPDEINRLAAIAGFQLDASNEDLASITPQIWTVISAFNEPPSLFRHSGILVRIEHEDGDDGLDLVRMTLARMTYLLARIVTWYRVSKKGERRTVLPPKAVVIDVLATPNPPVPHLKSITHSPTFDRTGRLHQVAGYIPAIQSYYKPANGFCVPEITPNPSAEQVKQARAIVFEVIEDFPFTNGAERAHALALGFLPFIRNMIDGPTPLHIIEKPAPGTGGTLLAKALTYPSVASNGSFITEAKSDDEWRKRITSVLKRGPAVVVIDNLNREVSSAALSCVLTQTSWEDRILGQSDMIRLPNRAAWIVTGNNPSFSHEIARRSIRIRLDARMDRAWLRKDFHKPHLEKWIAENRGKIVWAYLTLCQAWITAGQPRATHLRALGGFETWSEVIGALLEFIDVPAFLNNLDDFYIRVDSEHNVWREFFGVWWQRFQNRPIGTSDLWPLIQGSNLDLDLGEGERSGRTRLGKKLASMRDRQFGPFRLTSIGPKQGAEQWQLLLLGELEGNLTQPSRPQPSD